MTSRRTLLALAVASALPELPSWAQPAPASKPEQGRPSFSGIYPHLAYFNNEAECGTGAVVPFADRLWVITYGPHLPKGSSDRLYEIDASLNITTRPESIGGTPANRMIHRESNQLFIGPYAIDKDRNVRPIPYDRMFGRHTANARHLADPANKIYYCTMEEGFYEVDVRTLEVKELYHDGNKDQGGHGGKLLPGYHGKGAYSGQGVLVYANNGETGAEAQRRPDVPSGVLAEWDGKDWKVIKRNQFTDVTGPGGIYGSDKPQTDPIWSIGWDHRSLMLMVRDKGEWTMYRLPKATHTYDGAHGWNTEWPRIRDIGEDDLLMTMHGTFWRFPKNFSKANFAGIRPRSTYIKVIGDFARWGDRIVFGCDDTAKSEFLNKRAAKGNLLGPGQSQSNLWFASPPILDQLGTPIGKGAVWLNEPVKGGVWSDPFLFAGYERRGVHLVNGGAEQVTFEFDVDTVKPVTLAAGQAQWVPFTDGQTGEWVRVRTDKDVAKATALFAYSNNDKRTTTADPIFDGLAKAGDAEAKGGLVRARGENKRTLQLAAMDVKGQEVTDVGSYELDESMKLTPMNDGAAMEFLKKNAAIPMGVLGVDAASVIFIDDAGRRWRLPKGDAAFDDLTGKALYRIDREVCTERDLFNAHGTFYELPAENAGGFGKVRPVTTHNRRIMDYCSYRGLLILTGISGGENNSHIVRSADGKAAVWAGVVDDLWKMGKVVGRGGPWNETAVKTGVASDPYLMNGYDAKTLTLSADKPVKVKVEVDLTGDGLWVTYRDFDLKPGEAAKELFPPGYQAAWVRTTADSDCVATVQLEYS
jgi:hypothetical protein